MMMHRADYAVLTFQGARGNDGLPGPGGPPVRTKLPTLHKIVLSLFLLIYCTL